MSYIITSTGVSIYFDSDGSQRTIETNHPQYSKIATLATQGRYTEILDILDVKSKLIDYVYRSQNGRFTIENGIFHFDGNQIDNTLTERMIDMSSNGLDISSLENFLVNLMDNTSYRAVSELYGFLEHGKLPITSDGHFLAYKRISHDYTDVYTGTMDNSIGSVVSMPRNAVNEDKDQTCSTGLHFCSYDYLPHFSGQRVVVLKINPRDVVSIPSDYNNSKGRACRYEVLRELTDWKDERIEGLVSDYGTYDYDQLNMDDEDDEDDEDFDLRDLYVENYEDEDDEDDEDDGYYVRPETSISYGSSLPSQPTALPPVNVGRLKVTDLSTYPPRVFYYTDAAEAARYVTFTEAQIEDAINNSGGMINNIEFKFVG